MFTTMPRSLCCLCFFAVHVTLETVPSLARRVQHPTLNAVLKSSDDATPTNEHNSVGEDIGQPAIKKLRLHPPQPPPVKTELPNWRHSFSFSIPTRTSPICVAGCGPRTEKNKECHDFCVSRAVSAPIIDEQATSVTLLLEGHRHIEGGGPPQNPLAQARNLGTGVGTGVGRNPGTSVRMSAGTGVGSKPVTGVGKSAGTSEGTSSDGLTRAKAPRKSRVFSAVRRHDWTEEEDGHIISLVGVLGFKWAKIAATALPGRTGNAVRNRYQRLKHKAGNDSGALDLGAAREIKPGDAWREEEDEALYGGVRHFGKSWVEIAELLPGRTQRAVSHRFQHVLRPKQLAALGQPDAPISSILQK